MKNMDVMNINTLGDLIKYHRQKKDFSISELSRKTKIRIQQLINLEENKLNELPNRVYLVGFLKTLCAELEMNLDLALKFLNESNINEDVSKFLPAGKEIKPIHFKFIEKSSDKKILLAAILICSFMVVISIGMLKIKDQFKQSDVVIPKQPIVANEIIIPEKLASPKEFLVATKPQSEEKAAPVMQQLTITAKNGTAFIAFRVDQNRLVKFFLEKGKVLELKGEQIRIDAGNPDALEFYKNGEPLTVEKSAQGSHIHLAFPQEQKEKQMQTNIKI